MVVINPSDDIEAKAAVKAAYEYVGPVYLRFGRLAAPVINDRPDYKFEIGKGLTLREGKDLTKMCIRDRVRISSGFSVPVIRAATLAEVRSTSFCFRTSFALEAPRLTRSTASL